MTKILFMRLMHPPCPRWVSAWGVGASRLGPSGWRHPTVAHRQGPTLHPTHPTVDPGGTLRSPRRLASAAAGWPSCVFTGTVSNNMQRWRCDLVLTRDHTGGHQHRQPEQTRPCTNTVAAVSTTHPHTILVLQSDNHRPG